MLFILINIIVSTLLLLTNNLGKNYNRYSTALNEARILKASTVNS
jgi:hypothetical protein